MSKVASHYITLTERVIQNTIRYALDSRRGYSRLLLDYAKMCNLIDKDTDGVPCHGCRSTIFEGEICVSKQRHSGTTYYHKKCAEKLNIIIKKK